MSERASTILVVDDEPEMCRLLGDMLSEEGYQVQTAADARSALEHIYHSPPDLLITDLKMPHADGLSLVRKIREVDNDIVIIMITAYASVESSVEGLRAGIFDYLPKPVDISHLKASVRRGLEMQRLRRENQRLLEDLTQANAELKQTLEELKRTQAALLQSGQMASLGMLVAGVAHELNNPISFVFGNLKHLRDYAKGMLRVIEAYEEAAEHLPADARTRIAEAAESADLDYLRRDLDKLIAACLDGAERAGNIVRDLRIFSRADEQEVREVDLAAELEAALNLLGHRLKQGITVKKDLADLPPMTCYAGQLGQLLLNLLANAVQAVDPKRGRIRVSARRDGDMVRITVSDNGPGIPAEHLEHIFDPFFTTRPVGEGMGLGLSICYGIVRRHGGEISAASTPGKGATFTVRLPLNVKTPPEHFQSSKE